jgi:hypothetical protein
MSGQNDCLQNDCIQKDCKQIDCKQNYKKALDLVTIDKTSYGQNEKDKTSCQYEYPFTSNLTTVDGNGQAIRF